MIDEQALRTLQQALRESGFSGDIEQGYGERIVAATDNSIYQVLPRAILYPQTQQDIQHAMRCVHRLRDLGFNLTARGGGTGTNGQSLSDNLLLDCGRHLNRIIEFDPQRRTICIEPGIVLDQLNDFLAPHGLFFPIDISSSSRATLGGMVATDASGKGSLIYGKTSDYIEALDLVLADGNPIHLREFSVQELADDRDPAHRLLRPLQQQLVAQRDEIDRVFPVLQRGLTGYNLQHPIKSADRFNPCYLVAGAEGTLGLVSRITLRLLPRPTHRLLGVVFYDDFNRSLAHVQQLLEARPAAIEMLDDKILAQARRDNVWADVQSVLELPSDRVVRSAHFVEFVARNSAEIEQQRQRLDQVLQATAANHSVIMSKIESDPGTIAALWNLRKRAVGLLGRLQDGKRGVAFVEDSAVPPQNLVSYVTGFRALLDEHGLDYGMYGHADAGVLHVRPTLNLMQARDRELLRVISDRVAQLARDNGGVLWGEHGRGFRGEYGELFFGERLYALLHSIKDLFDPYNLLNPGKLVTPSADMPVTPMDGPPLRSALDEQIDSGDQSDYQDVLFCNGNGACFNMTPNDAMCPSYKATRNKLYSPKGRAAMLREWLRLRHQPGANPKLAELEAQLYTSLRHCLSCKSCTSNCPLKVDIPELKSRFLETWHLSRRRPLADLFIRYFESLTALGGRTPALGNLLLHGPVTAGSMQRLTRLNRLPRFSRASADGVPRLHARDAGRAKLGERDVILLRDNYLNAFDRPVLVAAASLLQRLGCKVYLSEPVANGKLLHLKGMRSAFARQARKTLELLKQYQASSATLVNLETMTRLMPAMEYADSGESVSELNLLGIEEFLARMIPQSLPTADAESNTRAVLLPHCLEQTAARESSAQWLTVFTHLGISLKVEQPGCCGMSGLFGHEIDNNRLADEIFSMQWSPLAAQPSGVLLATGFSCRCQLKNHGYQPMHPVELLDRLLPGQGLATSAAKAHSERPD